jgi:hypothetical protein
MTWIDIQGKTINFERVLYFEKQTLRSCGGGEEPSIKIIFYDRSFFFTFPNKDEQIKTYGELISLLNKNQKDK